MFYCSLNYVNKYLADQTISVFENEAKRGKKGKGGLNYTKKEESKLYIYI